jgi:hypothetical protein
MCNREVRFQPMGEYWVGRQSHPLQDCGAVGAAGCVIHTESSWYWVTSVSTSSRSCWDELSVRFVQPHELLQGGPDPLAGKKVGVCELW